MSGYTHCACRDCMDITVSRNTNNPELCALCDDVGCVAWPQGSSAAIAYDCQREDAYESEDNLKYLRTRSCGCGASGVHGVDHED